MVLDGTNVSGVSIFGIDGELNPTIIITAVDDNLILVETDNNGVEINEIPTIDSTRPVVEIIFDSSKCQIITGGKDAIQKTIDVGRIGLAADLLGASQNMINKLLSNHLNENSLKELSDLFRR